MYITRIRPGSSDTSQAPRSTRAARALRAVPANVLILGAVSLITDISSEMTSSVLPLYVLSGLGLTVLQFGLLDATYAGATTLLNIVGGWLADLFGARKLMAGAGYLISAVSKLGLPFVGGSLSSLGLLLAVDRAGKGLRTAPRDALISLSTPPDQQGRAFGVHRSLDTVGAFLGPLVAFGLLGLVTVDGQTGYDAIFVVAFCIAMLGVVALFLFVRSPNGQSGTADGTSESAAESATDDTADAGASARARRRTLRATADLLRSGGARIRRICLGAFVLGFATVSDSFVYLSLMSKCGLSSHWFPLLPLGTAGVYLLAATPLGLLADRWGRRRIFLLGHLALVAVYLVIATAGPGQAWVPFVALGLHGLFYAATDGVLVAFTAPLLAEEIRTSGISLVQTAQALGRSASSVAFASAWTAAGVTSGLLDWSGILVCAAAVAAVLLFGRPGTSGKADLPAQTRTS